LDPQQLAGLDQLREQEVPGPGPDRQAVLAPERSLEIRAGEDLVRPGGAKQAVAPVARHELVSELLARRMAVGEELRREQSLDEVVDPLVAVAPGDAQDPGLAERLEDRPDLIRRAPVPVDRPPRRA